VSEFESDSSSWVSKNSSNEHYDLFISRKNSILWLYVNVL